VSRVIVVTACDHRHYELGSELIASLRALPQRDFAIGFVRMGDTQLPEEIAGAVDHLVDIPKDRDDLAIENGFDAAYLGVKGRLPELFPDFDTYVWMDGDTWLQNAQGIQQVVRAADSADLAAAPQLDANYWSIRLPDDHTTRAYMAIYGEAETRQWALFPMINAGIFSAKAASPLWRTWTEALRDARDRQADSPHPYYSDQIPLHRLVMTGRLTLHPLSAVNNWLVWFARPILDARLGKLRAANVPFEEINIVHLAGLAKDMRYGTSDNRTVSYRYSDIRAFFGLDG
jgi:hypothetical protein